MLSPESKAIVHILIRCLKMAVSLLEQLEKEGVKK